MTSSLIMSEAAILVPEHSAQDIDMDAILRRRAAATPDEVALRFLKNGEDDIVELTYRQLDLRAARLARQPSVDGARRLFAVDWDDDDATVLATGDDARTALDRALDRGAVATAAQLLGLGQQMLDLTVDYVKERKQFGVPIGSFQAVKHHLADAMLQLEFARPVVYAAAYALATDDPNAARAASHAKVAASEAALLVGRQALQCHGAIGYTVEYDLHLYLKRSWALAAAWGDAAHHHRRVADLVLGPLPS